MTQTKEHPGERLAEAEKLVRLLSFMPNPFFSVSKDWKLTYMNPAAEKTLRLAADEVVGRSLWEAFPGLVGSRFADAYERAARDGIRVTLEDYYPDFDRWYEVWAYPFDNGLAVSFFDVTERKRAELELKAEKQRFEAIFFGSASPLVFFRGPSLVYEVFNEKYQQLVPQRELLGKPLLEALPELAGTGFPELIKKVFDTGVPHLTHEELAPLKNPETGEIEDRYFDTAISRIHDGEGKPYGVFVQATETTDRVLARKKIEQALSARDTFLSIASHELRTPITGLKLQTEMIKRRLAKGDLETLGPERLSKLVMQSDAALSRMSRLVDDMLDISRIQAGHLSLHRETTDLVAFVRNMIDRFSEELARAEIQVALEAPPKLLASIDRFRMEQALTNLVTNALRYAPRAPISISLEERATGPRIVFEDHGPGIAAEDQERIFERFVRLVSPNELSGMGLGLFIVRQILQAHGGTIRAESGDGMGARFVIDLPPSGEVGDGG